MIWWFFGGALFGSVVTIIVLACVDHLEARDDEGEQGRDR